MDIARRAGTAISVAVLGATVLTGPLPAGAADGPKAGSTVVTRATQAQTNSILRLYRAYFLRNPDRAGLAYWTGEYSSGRMTLNRISELFARSEEFKRRYGSLSDAEFVRLVYQNVLGRQPDSAGESHWTAVLRRGTSRGEIMVGFSESLEFQRRTGTVVEAGSAEPWATALLARVNAERAAHGLHALTMCPPLTAAAAGHSADQARNNFLSHQGSNGSQPGERIAGAGYYGRAWGENVASGFTSIDQVVAAWMTSATHRENILNQSFQHVGFGRVAAGDGTLYWTQDYGAGGSC